MLENSFLHETTFMYWHCELRARRWGLGSKNSAGWNLLQINNDFTHQLTQLIVRPIKQWRNDFINDLENSASIWTTLSVLTTINMCFVYFWHTQMISLRRVKSLGFVAEIQPIFCEAGAVFISITKWTCSCKALITIILNY